MMIFLKPVTDFAALLRICRLGTVAECASCMQRSRDVCGDKIYATAPSHRNSDISGHAQVYKSENFCIGFDREDMAHIYVRHLN